MLWLAGSGLVVGLLYLGEGAVRRNVLHYGLGIWLALVSTVSLGFGTPVSSGSSPSRAAAVTRSPPSSNTAGSPTAERTGHGERTNLRCRSFGRNDDPFGTAPGGGRRDKQTADGVLATTEESWAGPPVEADVPGSQAGLDQGLNDWANRLKATAEACSGCH